MARHSFVSGACFQIIHCEVRSHVRQNPYGAFRLHHFALLPIPALSDDFARTTTKQQYLDLVAGKRWYLGDGYALSRRNGRMTGEFGGEKLKGAWAWRGDMWCRTLQTHAKNTDCLALSINGNKLRSIREQGAGDTLIFINK